MCHVVSSNLYKKKPASRQANTYYRWKKNNNKKTGEVGKRAGFSCQWEEEPRRRRRRSRDFVATFPDVLVVSGEASLVKQKERRLRWCVCSRSCRLLGMKASSHSGTEAKKAKQKNPTKSMKEVEEVFIGQKHRDTEQEARRKKQEKQKKRSSSWGRAATVSGRKEKSKPLRKTRRVWCFLFVFVLLLLLLL